MHRALLQGLLMTLVLFLAVPALAQDTATITGTVTDPTGAVVVGAQVTVTNVATNIADTTSTNAEGIYRVVALRPGTYRVTVTAAGFKRFLRDNVTLSVGATVSVSAALEIGALADTVEVSAALPLLETETSSTGTLVKGDYFYRMPLYQRWSRAILYLTPGVNVNGFGWGGDLGGFQINGSPDGEIGFFEDGIFGVRPGATSTTETILNTIDEIKVLTTALPAEYGHAAGGALVVVKKSGTNQLHGLVSELFRERPMQHRRFFQRERFEQVGTTLHFHMPDANLSGPVYIPKLYDGRNRTFFMVAGQWLIERQGETVTYSVPTPEMLNGDFSFGGRSGVNPIYDPRTTKLVNGQWSRDPYVGNIIPKAGWDPVATKFLSRNVWTKPNLTGTPTATGFGDNLIATRQKTVDYYTYSSRLDHQLTQAIKTFVTWNYNTRTGWTPDMSIQDPLFDSSTRTSVDATNVTGIGLTWTLSPTLISETRASYYRSKVEATWPGFGTDYGALLGIPNIGVGSMPSVTGIPSVSNPSIDVREILTAKEDMSKLVGKHAFKMGYEIMRMRQNSYSIDNNAGSFSLTGTGGLQPNGSGIPNTGGHSLTQLMSGAVSTYTRTINLLSNLPRNWIHSLYFQDDWKVLPNLTLNLGVRWQTQSIMNNKYKQQSSFDPNAADNVVAGAKGVITHPKTLHNKDWNNFQPRVGLAWQARRNIVVRGGFALSTVDESLPGPPTQEYGSITGRIDTPSGTYFPMFQLNQGPPASLLIWPVTRPDGTIPYASTNYSSRGATWVDPNRKVPYTMSWNFGFQYNFSSNYLVELTYTGNRLVNQYESMQINQWPYDWAWNLYQTNLTLFNTMRGNTQAYRPFTNFGGITFQTNGGGSNYHGGTVKLEKRFSKGLSFLTFYTFSKAIDFSTGSRLIDRGLDRARASFDRTHQYTGSMNYELPFGKGRKWVNQSRLWDAVVGGFDFVFIYRISSGNPMTFGFGGSPYSYMPTGNIAYRSGRPNSTGQAAHLRDGWADLGTDRWTRANQNKLIQSMDYFTYPEQFTFGNVGRNTMDRQRFIDHNFSAAKEWRIKERYTVQFRYDFQNPFKWYNLGAPDTSVNFTNPGTFGTINPSTSNEGTTANGGGQPLMNITIAFRW